MIYTIALCHRRTPLAFVIKAEKDDIFIAYPKPRTPRNEVIFLTKTGGQWVGDAADKKLVERIGREIDAASIPQPAHKQKARMR